jgi:hypothetical protein
MSMALGPQHHAMLLAMQQQQQTEYDPAALARLQLFGGAGFPPEVRLYKLSSQFAGSLSFVQKPPPTNRVLSLVGTCRCGVHMSTDIPQTSVVNAMCALSCVPP